MKKLEEYEKRRDFKRTSEPEGNKNALGKNVFVIHKHDASQLHYDLRLRIGDVLKSWAIPKRPTGKYGEKRLAVETEDHPLSYFSFRGVIPEGNYGAGKVEIWDTGEYENVRGINMEEAYQEGKIEVNLKGKKLKGAFTLIQTKFNNNSKNWLLIKTKEKVLG